MKLNLLRFVYRGLLTGMPMVTYNPITKVPIHIPFTIEPKSTYVNYKLNSSQVNEIQTYIYDYDSDLTMTPVKLLQNETNHSYYLSVNVYNCSSPIFFNNNQQISRLEINTYVQKWNESNQNYDKGTLILDYTSNALSMDPIHIFKQKGNLSFENEETKYSIVSNSLVNDISFHFDFIPWTQTNKTSKLHDDLIEFSDIIYYKNGIYDKLYYDSSLVKAFIEEPYIIQDSVFYYRNMCFYEPESVFYFKNPISFVGSMWENVFYHSL